MEYSKKWVSSPACRIQRLPGMAMQRNSAVDNPWSRLQRRPQVRRQWLVGRGTPRLLVELWSVPRCRPARRRRCIQPACSRRLVELGQTSSADIVHGASSVHRQPPRRSRTITDSWKTVVAAAAGGCDDVGRSTCRRHMVEMMSTSDVLPRGTVLCGRTASSAVEAETLLVFVSDQTEHYHTGRRMRRRLASQRRWRRHRARWRTVPRPITANNTGRRRRSLWCRVCLTLICTRSTDCYTPVMHCTRVSQCIKDEYFTKSKILSHI